MSIKTVSTRINNSVLNDFFEPWDDWFSSSRLSNGPTMPKVNISEDKDKYNLSLVAPGIHKKDFNINVEGDVLTISAEHETDKENNNERYHRREYNYSSFSRSFTLPGEVAKDKIEASYDGGVLKLVLPKNETSVKKTENKVIVK